MTEYDCIIIGAGAGGLAAALQLSRQGRRVLVLERQPFPGGLATTFKRGGFTFEASMHCVDGLGEGGELREFLSQDDTFARIEAIELDNFARIIYPDFDFTADFNRDHLADALKNYFPSEKADIDKLFSAMDKFFRQFERYAQSNLPEWLKMLQLLIFCPAVIKMSLITAQGFLDKYTSNKKLKGILGDIWRLLGLPPGRVSALYFLLIFQGYHYLSTVYVKGGFQKLFEAMAARIRKNGSEIRFNVGVKSIATYAGKRVKSVVTESGEEFIAKAVISNANAISTLTQLLDDTRLRQEYQRKLAAMEKSLSAVQVYLGLKCPAKKLGMNRHTFSVNTSYDHDENLQFMLRHDYERCPLELVDHAQIDPGLAPEGKGTLLIMVLDQYSNWENLDPDAYARKKKEVAEKLIRRAEHYLPGLAENIECVEVATPLTLERYTLSPQGAIYGFAQTLEQSGIRRLSQEASVAGLFLAGAWTRPGHGVHACFFSGMEAADLASAYLKRRK
ncbi:MAG: NAD(P)/FAD-dependent oxidoreductase [Candidatus Omnitrophota bacterium]|nr:NAD(P)/FAD-dependent oxidoreductase [Candidatus Omnitrophota bacterium]